MRPPVVPFGRLVPTSRGLLAQNDGAVITATVSLTCDLGVRAQSMVNYRELEVSDLVELRSLTIGEIFPGLRQFAMVLIDENSLDQRSITTLRRRGCATWGDLHSLTVGDLWSVPNAGRLTVERILAAAREKDALTPVAGDYWPPPAPGTAVGAAVPMPEARNSPEHGPLRALAEILVEWAIDTHGAANIGDVVEALERPLPPDVAAALADARQVAIGDVIRGADFRDTAGLIADFLEALGSDARFVVERHIARPIGRLPTLDAVGEGEGITRERVRQIVKRGLASAERLRLDTQYRLLSWRADGLRHTLSAAGRVTSPSVISAVDARSLCVLVEAVCPPKEAGVLNDRAPIGSVQIR